MARSKNTPAGLSHVDAQGRPAMVDVAGKPAVVTDFTLPTEGYESPWAMAQLVFEHDSATLPTPPKTLGALQDWIKANPGRFTYPQPPDYLGTTFLKQVLYGVMADPSVLQSPVDDASYAAQVAPLWTAIPPRTWPTRLLASSTMRWAMPP